MNLKNTITKVFLTLSLIVIGFGVHEVNANETISDEKVFEYIVKSSNGFKPEDEVQLTQEHYDEVRVLSTRFEHVETVGGPILGVYYLNDLSLLSRLSNLETLHLHIPTVANAWDYDINDLNNLPYTTLQLGLEIKRDLSDEEKKALHENQRYILDHLNPQNEISVNVNKYGRLDPDSLIGFDMKPKINYLQTVDKEIDAEMIYADYEYSHEENGVKYYKAKFEMPYDKYVTINDDAILQEDLLGEDASWDVSLSNQDIIPKFYDKQGAIIPGSELNSTYTGYGVDSMDVYISEDKINTFVNKYLEDVSYVSKDIFSDKLVLISAQQDLEEATDPIQIAEIEEEIEKTKRLIAEGEKELEELKANRGTLATKVVDFKIIQAGGDTSGNHVFFTEQEFDGVLVFPEVDGETYTVTFESNGGTEFPQLHDVLYDAKIDEPMHPVKGDKKFEGWFKEATLENKWDFNVDTVTSDITLYAKWNEVFYDVDFDSMGGSDVASQTVEENTLVTEPSIPTYGDKTFEGWYTTDTYTTKWNFVEDKVTDNMTLYAKWSTRVIPSEKYNVTFNSNGGNAVAPYANVEANSKILKPTDPTFGNKVFEGWYLDNGAFLNKWNFDEDLVNENIILYAKWKPKATEPVIPEEPEIPVTPQPEKPEDKTPSTGITTNAILYVLIVVAGATTLNLLLKKKKYK